MPAGDWETDKTPSVAALAGASTGNMVFHVLVKGRCWLKIDGAHHELEAGDVLLFPFGTGHQLGHGESGYLVEPTRHLPPGPWRRIPVLQFGDAPPDVQLLCGYLRCDAVRFGPLNRHLPNLILVRTASETDFDWLRAIVKQMVDEVDHPGPGSVSVLERLTEIAFIEIMRHRIANAAPGATGIVAALNDPKLSRCLELLHGEPERNWTLTDLARAGALSRSSLIERFGTVLGVSPMHYLREWRLYLASVDLATSDEPIAHVAEMAGYSSEAAFNRAFARANGMPPARFRAQAKA
jgi:AraC-like DNA-binding protein